MKNTIYKLLSLAGFAAALMLTACDNNDPIYDTVYPKDGSITFAATWDQTDLPGPPEDGFKQITLSGGEEHYPTPGLDEGLWILAPGDYTAYLNTEAIGIGPMKSELLPDPVAVAWDADAPDDPSNPGTPLTGTFVVHDPEFFYSGRKEFTAQADKGQTVTAEMRQLVRELTLIVRPAGDAKENVWGIAAVMGGVAGGWNLDTDAAYGEAVSTAPVFTKNADGDWTATVRLLGITGAEQKLTGRISFAAGSNLEPIDFTKNLHDVAGFAEFNSDKKTPLALEAQLVDVHNKLQLGDFTPIPGWTGTEEDIDGYRTFKSADLKPGDFYYNDNTVSDGGLRAIKDGKYVYADGVFKPETGKTCIGIVFWLDPANPRKGKIVSLDEENTDQKSDMYGVAWGPMGGGRTGADSPTDGQSNTAKIMTLNSWSNLYPAFKWAADHGAGWYLPAYKELLTLYAAWSSSSGTSEVGGQPTIFNHRLSDAGGIGLSEELYWSSTETEFEPGKAWNIFFLNGIEYYGLKYFQMRVRAVSTIDLDAAPPLPGDVDRFEDIPANTYNAVGIPGYRTTPGPGSWAGNLKYTTLEPGGDPYYMLTAWGGVNVPMLLEYRDRFIFLNQTDAVIQDSGNPNISGFAGALYLNSNNQLDMVPDSWDYRLKYDKTTKNFDFTNTYKGYNCMVGIIAFDLGNGGTFAGTFTELYLDAKVTLTDTPSPTTRAAGAPGMSFSGTPVDISGIEWSPQLKAYAKKKYEEAKRRNTMPATENSPLQNVK